MTLDSLLAVSALLIAVYQIMPRARQLELSFRLRKPDKILLALALVVILYLQFYSVFASVGWTPHLGFRRWNVTPERASFVVLLVAATGVAIRMRRAKLAAAQVSEFKRLVDELVSTQAFQDLASLLEANFDRLVQIANQKLRSSRARALLLEWKPIDVIHPHPLSESILNKVLANEELSDEEKLKLESVLRPPGRSVLVSWLAIAGSSACRRLASVFPDHEAEEDDARETLERCLGSREFAAHVARAKPYLGLLWLRAERYTADRFLSNYVRALLLNPSSVLHSEIRASQSGRFGNPGHFCIIPESSHILTYFLGDPRVAEKLYLWRPIGNTVISELERLGKKPESDDYNSAPDAEFANVGMAQSPLFAGIALFDVMVTQALLHRIEWHMWLYYFPVFTSKILHNYAPLHDLGEDRESEFPTRYSKLLHEIFTTLELWIRAVQHVPARQANVLLMKVATEHENGNIPKSAIFALSSCLRSVLESEKLEQEVAMTIAKSVLELRFELQTCAPEFAQVLVEMIKPTRATGDGNRLYEERLREAVESLDRYRYGASIKRLETELFARPPH